MRTKEMLGCVALLVLVATVATTRSDTGSAGSAEPEPITGTAVVPGPGDKTPMRDPFTLYSHGQPAGTEWTYDQLTPAERSIVEPALAAESSGVNDAYARASRQRAQAARAEADGARLGVDSLESTGVVP